MASTLELISRIILVLAVCITGCLCGKYCTKYEGTSFETRFYCSNGCCYDYGTTNARCCSYTTYYYSGRYYWGIGSGISAVFAITVGLIVYFCCRKKQRAANSVVNGPSTNVMYGSRIQTSDMAPGVAYTTYPGQTNPAFSGKPGEAPAYAAKPPAYDDVVNQNQYPTSNQNQYSNLNQNQYSTPNQYPTPNQNQYSTLNQNQFPTSNENKNPDAGN